MSDPAKEIILDFSNVKPFEPLDEKKTYLLKITNNEIKKANDSGKPMSKVEFTVMKPTGFAKRKIFRNYMLTENLQFLYGFIQAADPKAKLGEGFRYNPSAYIGLDVAGKVKNREYNGQIVSDLASIHPASTYKEEA